MYQAWCCEKVVRRDFQNVDYPLSVAAMERTVAQITVFISNMGDQSRRDSMAFMGGFGFWCESVFDTPQAREHFRLAESDVFIYAFFCFYPKVSSLNSF